MRMTPPRCLDKFSASPMGDRKEFDAAFAAVKKMYPNVKLGYIGTDGTNHYFQEWGVAEAYVVPVSKNFKIKKGR